MSLAALREQAQKNPKGVLRELLKLPKEAFHELAYRWDVWARDAQLPPEGDWDVWLNMSGRGTGKTRSGAELVRTWRESGVTIIGLVGQTVSDARKVMVEGVSGILKCSPPWDVPDYLPSARTVTWSATERYPWETVATTYSGDKLEQLRGPQWEKVWIDELAKFKKAEEILEVLDFAVRLGESPQLYVSTTPVPSKAMRALVKDPGTVVTNESTLANARNLPKKYLKRLLRKYDGTRVGRQELEGILLEDVEGALWTHALIEKHRGRLVASPGAKATTIAPAGFVWMIYDFKTSLFRPVPDFVRVAVAVDPAVSHGPDSADTGIVVAAYGTDGHVYILDDKTCHLSPTGWAEVVVDAYRQYQADVLYGEVNNGGELVESNVLVYAAQLTGPNKIFVNFEQVRASHGKQTRAEPVSTLYEAGLAHHLGDFPELEDQQCTWVPGQKSPDRLDADVWAVSPLAVEPEPETGIYDPWAE